MEWNFETKLKGFMRRFWKDPYSESEKIWMDKFCKINHINPKTKFKLLIDYLKK